MIPGELLDFPVSFCAATAKLLSRFRRRFEMGGEWREEVRSSRRLRKMDGVVLNGGGEGGFAEVGGVVADGGEAEWRRGIGDGGRDWPEKKEQTVELNRRKKRGLSCDGGLLEQRRRGRTTAEIWFLLEATASGLDGGDLEMAETR